MSNLADEHMSQDSRIVAEEAVAEEGDDTVHHGQIQNALQNPDA